MKLSSKTIYNIAVVMATILLVYLSITASKIVFVGVLLIIVGIWFVHRGTTQKESEKWKVKEVSRSIVQEHKPKPTVVKNKVQELPIQENTMPKENSWYKFQVISVVLIILGFILSSTGIGAIIGVPLIAIGIFGEKAGFVGGNGHGCIAWIILGIFVIAFIVFFLYGLIGGLA